MAFTPTKIAAVLLAGLAMTAGPAVADGRRAGSAPSGGSQAAPRRPAAPTSSAPAVAVPRGASPVIVRPYVYPYRPYGVLPYSGYRPYYGYRPYLYSPAVGLGLYFGLPYAAYGYPGYAYGPSTAYGYYSVVPGRSYGSVHITDAPQDAEVYVDGYYAGLVSDYNGTVNLEAGPHHIEVALPGETPAAFDVRVESGQTITYRANPARP